MIIFHDVALALITPARNASSSLHAAAERLRGQCFYGPAPEGPGYDKHSPTIPAEALNYRLAIILRDPIDRLISLYHHHHLAEGRYGRPGLALYFFASAVERQEQFLAWFYRWPQAKYLEAAQAQGVKLEGWTIDQAATELTKLGRRNVQFPRLNTSDRRPTAYYIEAAGPTLRAAAESWAAADYAAWPDFKWIP